MIEINLISGRIKEEQSELERELQSPKTDDRSLLRKVTDVYFKPQSFEKRLYEALGVRKFQKLYFMTFGKLIEYSGDKGLRLPNSSDRTLKSYEKTTRVLEGVHLAGAAVSTPIIVGIFATGNYVEGTIGFGINALVNLYPIMLQRYNRSRISSILKRRRARRNRK